MADPDPISGYCDYLDKEMTIMGLLSAFAVGVPAVVLDKLLGAEKQSHLYMLWDDHSALLIGGSIALGLAGLAFYLQRSHLAFFIGQLRFSQTTARYANMSAKSVLKNADAWWMWVSYQTGFVFLTLGFALYAAALTPALAIGTAGITILVFSGAALFCSALNAFVKYRYRYHDHPWQDFVDLKKPHT